jgi:oligopeptide transport system permease protein
MAIYIFRRVLWLVPAMFFISLVTFGLMHAIEGPFRAVYPPIDPSVQENLDRKYGLDKPLVEQYWLFLRNALQGDLGTSIKVQLGEPVTEMLLRGLRSTFVVGALALSLGTVTGIGLGVFAALNRNRVADYASVIASTAGAAVPAFVLGIVFIHVFATRLGLLPTGGWSLNDGIVPGWLPQPRYMVLPVLTMAVLPAAYLARITRASLLDVLNQEYMRTAKAKGLPRSAVLWGHAMRNAAIPIVSVIGPLAGAVLTGSFIIENMFAVPGVGGLMVLAIDKRDYNVIMGLALFYAMVAVFVNLAVDIAYAYLDPRVRYR